MRFVTERWDEGREARLERPVIQAETLRRVEKIVM